MQLWSFLRPAQGLLAVALLAVAMPTLAADRLYTGFFSNTFLQGYDPVAYFTQGMPVKGRKDLSTEYEGVEIRFASEAHRSQFLSDPEAYLPQYGGYCAWAVAQGDKAKGDARYWKVVDNKLYLNYDQRIQAAWEQDISGFIEQGDANWPGVIE